jgi:aldehyde dehydrogenase (NAD+)
VSGGKTDAADRYIQPTILEDVSMEDTVMKDEIFGPVLPVFTFKTDGEVLQLVEKNPYPLALYVFSGSKSRTDYFIKNIRFGGGAVNETILHLGNSKLPFGGVGYSGIGSYHGKHSFDTFTHYKSVLNRANWFEPSFRHAPFTNAKASLWKWMLGKF